MEIPQWMLDGATDFLMAVLKIVRPVFRLFRSGSACAERKSLLSMKQKLDAKTAKTKQKVDQKIGDMKQKLDVGDADGTGEKK